MKKHKQWRWKRETTKRKGKGREWKEKWRNISNEDGREKQQREKVRNKPRCKIQEGSCLERKKDRKFARQMDGRGVKCINETGKAWNCRVFICLRRYS